MATYYVRKDGNDTSGDGSTTKPWLTVKKALASVSLAGGHTINVGAGTYAEDSGGGRLDITYNYLDWVTVQAEDTANKPTITGNASASYGIRLVSPVSYLRFKNVIISDADSATGKTYGDVYLTGAAVANIEFDGCTFLWIPLAGTNTMGVYVNSTTGISVTNLTIKNCTFTERVALGALGLNSTAIWLNQNGAGGAITNAIIQNCTIVGEQIPVNLKGNTNFLIDGGTYSSSLTYGLLIGVNGPGTYANSGTIKNCTVVSAVSHALLSGSPNDGISILNNTIIGGDQALVIKLCTNITVTGNNIIGKSDGSSLNAFYCKGATNVTASNNTIRNSANSCVKVGVDSGTGTKCQNINFQRNKVFGSRSACVFSWGDAADDLGGGVCDYNAYYPGPAAAPFGLLRANANVNNLNELRLAWAGYGDGSNDRHSTSWDEDTGARFVLPLHHCH